MNLSRLEISMDSILNDGQYLTMDGIYQWIVFING